MTTKAPKERKSQFNPDEWERPVESDATDESIADAIADLDAEPPPVEQLPPDSAEVEVCEACGIEMSNHGYSCGERTYKAAHLAASDESEKLRAKYRAIEDIEHALCEQNTTFREAEINFNRADKQAKALKKAMEAEQSRLNGLVQNLYDARNGNFTPSLPFPADDAAPAEPEAWRDDLISSLNLSTGTQAAMVDAGIKTIGDLSDWTASGKQLTDIPGIGEGKAEKINLALDAYWASNPTPDITSGPQTENATDGSSDGEVAADAILEGSD